MQIGNAIAIAGVWIFCGLAWLSKTVTGIGAVMALVTAIFLTWWLK